MSTESRVVRPGPDARTVRTEDGRVLRVPNDWELLPPGDAALTRRVKAAGPSWTVQEVKGRRIFSKGVWAQADTIASLRNELLSERSSNAYAVRRASDLQRREKLQSQYEDDFGRAVIAFLNFDSKHASLAERLSEAVTRHATPVGSGTVARTKRISIEQRAESAVIAWMRHQTTAYDNLKIERVKGRRREVRRMLADQSRQLLAQYRRGESVDPDACPIRRALQG